jgi:hypothetical protein
MSRIAIAFLARIGEEEGDNLKRLLVSLLDRPDPH